MRHAAVERNIARAAAAAIVVASMLVAGPALAQRGRAATAPSVDRPDLIFLHYCSVCHGEKGDGKSIARFVLDPQPADFTDPKERAELSRAHMIETVRKGARTKEGAPTAMVSWTRQLRDEHIEAVVDYVIVTFMEGKVARDDQLHVEGHKHAGHDHSAKSVSQVDYPYRLKGNAARGKMLYARACARCHGENGDGRGNPALIGDTRPRNFHDADFREFATGFSMFAAVSRGNGHMPRWSDALSRQEIADVSAYVLKSFVRH
jgi:mono/diheme cytochrome c family protein